MAFKTYEPTKADQMRAYIAQCLAEGRTPRPIEIVAEMKKKEITISSGHASVVLRKFNKRRPSRRRTTAKLSKNGNGASTNGALNGACATKTLKNYDSLIKASQFARSCGGISQAKKMLGELEQIVDPFVRS